MNSVVAIALCLAAFTAGCLITMLFRVEDTVLEHKKDSQRQNALFQNTLFVGKEDLAPIHQQQKKGNCHFIDPKSPVTVNGIDRIVLASIPRSGNGWMRGLLEASTGVATESVFPEFNSSFHERSDAHGAECGWLGNCSLVHSSHGSMPVVVKTHFPFTTQKQRDELLLNRTSDAGAMTRLLIPARHPLENHEAWVRYVSEKVKFAEVQPFQEFKDFVQQWALFHDYWFSLGIPMTVYRYEDLVLDPSATLKEVLVSTSLWDYYELEDDNIDVAVSVPRLQAYKRKQFNAPTRRKYDLAHMYKKFPREHIDWILRSYPQTLQRLGYFELYNAWLTAIDEDWSEETATEKLRDVMADSRSAANWGDAHPAVSITKL
eukprot:m.183781 g.183781  ORF g.183781 m.183781 type:complete len:375 (+) comp14697_c0_seq8:90-1214(+)